MKAPDSQGPAWPLSTLSLAAVWQFCNACPCPQPPCILPEHKARYHSSYSLYPGLGRQPVANAKEGHGEEDEKGNEELPDGGASAPASQVPTPDGRQDLLADGMCYKLSRDGP